MTLPEFHQLLRRYLDGNATPDELQLIDRWYDSLNESVASEFTPAEQARLKARMWQYIDEHTAEPTREETVVRPLVSPVQRPLWQRTWAVAAAAIVLLVGSWLVWVNRPVATPAVTAQTRFQGTLATLSAGLLEQQTSRAGRWVRLPDNSQVFLKPNSAIRYARQSVGRERVVYLVGKAFFNVTKDARRPFRVVTEQIETQVLGTSFWMDAQAQARQVDVEVLTGKVQVYERDATRPKERVKGGAGTFGEGVILTPNQKVTVTNLEHWQTGLVASPHPITSEAAHTPVSPPSLRFDNATFADICGRLTQLYGIDLVLANPGMATCTFTGDLTGQSFYDQLDLVCRTVNARYDVRGTRILISGTACL